MPLHVHANLEKCLLHLQAFLRSDRPLFWEQCAETREVYRGGGVRLAFGGP
jgi:hypothetical protein